MSEGVSKESMKRIGPLWLIGIFVITLLVTSIVSAFMMLAYVDGEITAESFKLASEDAMNDPLFILGSIALQNGILMGFAYWFIIKPKQFTWKEMGLKKIKSKQIPQGFVVGFMAIIVMYGISIAVSSLGLESDGSSFPATESTTGLLTIIIGAVILAPIVEEIYFRGICFNGLKKYYGEKTHWMYRVIPFAFSGVFFGLAHFSVASFFMIVGAGVVFAWYLEDTESLTPPIIGHMINNSLAVLIFYGT